MAQIDPRYPPQPQKLRIPLYPLQNTVSMSAAVQLLAGKQTARQLFINELKHYCDDADVAGAFILLSSGSACLYTYLAWKVKNNAHPLKVALPAYCCPDVAYAIIKAGAIPVFLDIGASYGISTASANYAKQCGASIIIWPNFYGDRLRDEAVLAHIKSLGMDVILDDAQSFPASRIGTQYKTLVSFGVTKRLNGCGGGAMYLPCGAERSAFLSYANSSTPEANDEWQTILQAAKSKLGKWLGHKRKLEAELPVYVEKSARKALLQPMDAYHMNALQYATAAKRFRQLKANEGRLNTLYKALAGFATAHYGAACMEPADGLLSFPAIFALRFPGNSRYERATHLASLGIQTTWYYYPINKIPSFAQYESEATPNTDLLAAGVLMLPFGLGHVLKMDKRYRRIISAARP